MGEANTSSTAVRRLCGQVSRGPSGVAAQSCAWIRSAIPARAARRPRRRSAAKDRVPAGIPQRLGQQWECAFLGLGRAQRGAENPAGTSAAMRCNQAVYEAVEVWREGELAGYSER